MKKSLLVAFVSIACLVMVSSAFALTTLTTAASTVIGGAAVVPSTNVSVYATALPSSDLTHPNTYCVTTVHGMSLGVAAGKAYGALNSDPSIKAWTAPTDGSSVSGGCTNAFTLDTAKFL